MKSKKKYNRHNEEDFPQHVQEPAAEHIASYTTCSEKPVQYTSEELEERAISGILQMKEGKFTSHTDMIDYIWKLNG